MELISNQGGLTRSAVVQSQSIPWKRIFIEATAIVASIVVAFSIDAWWQNRTERIIEVQYLQALREDLFRSMELIETELTALPES